MPIHASAEELLELIEPKQQQGGELRVFLTYAYALACVPAMLTRAHLAQRQGRSVVVAGLPDSYVKRHPGLLKGLRVLEPVTLNYQGLECKELNLNQLLELNPDLVVIYDLAHLNPPGLRHQVRYQDVEEVLAHRIDVCTNLSVENLESVQAQIRQISMLKPHATVPDSLLYQAKAVEFVDQDPQDLLRELQEVSKSVTADTLTSASAKSEAYSSKTNPNLTYTEENLESLRQIALRVETERVTQRSKSRQAYGRYHSGEHVTVCIDEKKSNQAAIRSASRMAQAYLAQFSALHVQTPLMMHPSEEERSQLQENIALARKLGAQVTTIFSDDIARQIAEFARINTVSKLIIAKNTKEGSSLWRRIKPDMEDRLLALHPNVDIHIISNQAETKRGATYLAGARQRLYAGLRQLLPRDLTVTLVMLGLATVVDLGFTKVGLDSANSMVCYLLAVLVTSVWTSSRLWGILASVLNLVAYTVISGGGFSFSSFNRGAGYVVTLTVMLFASLFASSLVRRIRTLAQNAALRARRTTLILRANRELQRAKNLDQTIEAALNQVVSFLGIDAALYLTETKTKQAKLLDPIVKAAPGSTSVQGESSGTKTLLESASEKKVAQWVKDNSTKAGLGTDTFAQSKALYLPLRRHDDTIAILAVVGDSIQNLDFYDESLLEALADEIALALHRQQLNKERRKTLFQAEGERIRSQMLASVSLELRGPLKNITSEASTLLESSDELNFSQTKEIYEEIFEQSLRMTGLLDNITAIARLSQGTVVLKKKELPAQKTLQQLLKKISHNRSNYPVALEILDDSLVIYADERLLELVLSNLLQNVSSYNPLKTKTIITVTKENDQVHFSVSDNGVGIEPGVLAELKDKSTETNQNLGLGLRVCQDIISLHGGSFTIGKNEPQGTTVEFSLPLAKPVATEI